jgi:hypothetical protein
MKGWEQAKKKLIFLRSFVLSLLLNVKATERDNAKYRTPTSRIWCDNTYFIFVLSHLNFVSALSYFRFLVMCRRNDIDSATKREFIIVSLFRSFVLSHLLLRQDEVTTWQKSATIGRAIFFHNTARSKILAFHRIIVLYTRLMSIYEEISFILARNDACCINIPRQVIWPYIKDCLQFNTRLATRVIVPNNRLYRAK